jgi:hypothetical protein
MSSFFDDYENIPNPRLKEKRDSWIPEAIFNTRQISRFLLS